MSLQSDIAISTLSDLYGDAPWLNKPKTGQNSDKIMAEWDEALASYSAAQVKTACLKLHKWRKTRVFPTLSHLLSELVDEEPEERLAEPQYPRKPRPALLCTHPSFGSHKDSAGVDRPNDLFTELRVRFIGREWPDCKGMAFGSAVERAARDARKKCLDINPSIAGLTGDAELSALLSAGYFEAVDEAVHADLVAKQHLYG
ncbi:hypothetical protein FACS1894186_4720 [Alphaproteobacteria bacterium]|nr:hypothetical protein FACS1894186_4720 [Alphaproteobacteria bacterium]